MLVSSSSFRQLSQSAGVYLFLDEKDRIIYVGKAINLKKRVSSYFLDKSIGEKTKALVTQISKIKTIEVNSEIEAFLLEERLIKKYKPRYNISLKDAKTYPLVKINTKSEYPSITIVRKKDDPKALYFGPYTSVNSLKTVLKIVRKIFPYQSALNHQRGTCLYYHLGLCPCPETTNDKDYKKTVKHIIDFLSGKTQKVIRELEKEREKFSKTEDFEKASDIQTKIDSIKLVTSSFYKPFQYEENPNLKSDVLQMSLNSLIDILNENRVYVSKLERVECYDISNTQGTNSTASMVVLIDGEKDTSSYRRFKIRGFYNNKPNDFEMMKEVLRRRLKHLEWPLPDLIVVDGGKGQVSSAKTALKELNMNIPLIGLAKKEETIITSNLLEVKLPKDSKALGLIIKIRNEAHRFAITYHRKLRSKFIFD